MKPDRLLFFLRRDSGKSPDKGPSTRLLAAAAVLLLFGGSMLAFSWYSRQLASVSPADVKAVTIRVQAGMTTGDIAGILWDRGLIRDKTAFLVAAKRAGLDKSLQAASMNFRSMDVRG
jgi:cell division protein YceG involved in septum cleavage